MATKVQLPPDYEPSEDEEYMNPMQLEYFQNKLLLWKEEVLDESRETINHLKEENWHEPDLNDRASIEDKTAIELRTRVRYLKLIRKIDTALQRIKDTQNNVAKIRYGYCEETEEPIGLKRLKARPIATLSVEAQERHEKHEKLFNTDSEE